MQSNSIQTIEKPITECHYSKCESKEVDPKKIMKCGGCSLVGYCQKECQKDDWPSHKKECKEKQKQQTEWIQNDQAAQFIINCVKQDVNVNRHCFQQTNDPQLSALGNQRLIQFIFTSASDVYAMVKGEQSNVQVSVVSYEDVEKAAKQDHVYNGVLINMQKYNSENEFCFLASVAMSDGHHIIKTEVIQLLKEEEKKN